MKCFSRFLGLGLIFTLLATAPIRAQEFEADPTDWLQCHNREFNSGVINYITEGEKLARDILRVTAVLVLDGETHHTFWPFTTTSYEARYMLIKLMESFTATRDLLQTSVCQRTFLASDIGFSKDFNNADTQVMLSLGIDAHSLIRAVDLRRFWSWNLRQPNKPMTLLHAGPQQVLLQTHRGEEIRESLEKHHQRKPQIIKFSAPHPNGTIVQLEGIEVHVYPDATRGPLNAREEALLRSYFATFFRYLGLAPRMLLSSNGTHGDGGYKERHNAWLAEMQSNPFAEIVDGYIKAERFWIDGIKDHNQKRQAEINLRRKALAFADRILKQKPMDCNGGRCNHFPVYDFRGPKTFYFLFGNVDIPEAREAIKFALLPTIEQIKAKGFRVEIIDDATAVHLRAALENPDTHSIYWNSHTKESKYTARLFDIDRAQIPLSIFEQTLSESPQAQLKSITLVGCDPLKVIAGYGLESLSKREGKEFQVFYHEGDNRVEIDFSTMRLTDSADVLNEDFLAMVDNLPIIPPEKQTYASPNEQQAVLRIEVADAVTMGRKYNVELDGEIIGFVTPNTAPGFQTLSFAIPLEKLAVGRHRLKIFTTDRTVNFDETDIRNLLDDILIRNIRVVFSGGKTIEVTPPEEVTHIGDDRSSFGVLSSGKWMSIDSRGEFENASEGRINFSMDLHKYWSRDKRPKTYFRAKFKVEDPDLSQD